MLAYTRDRDSSDILFSTTADVEAPLFRRRRSRSTVPQQLVPLPMSMESLGVDRRLSSFAARPAQ